MIEALGGVVPAVKLQVAWFEHYGVPGIEVLRNTLMRARRAGLISVVDAKRGDVPHTMEAYLAAWLGEETPGGPGGDALTVNGWLGADVLDVCATYTQKTDVQCYVLTHTSNPGAAPLLGAKQADGTEWWKITARDVNERGLGAVVGATHSGLLKEALELMPGSPLLIPGIGAQGGDATETGMQLALHDDQPHLVVAARSLLPQKQCSSTDLTRHIQDAAKALANSLHNSKHG
jgi:orotidine-5'-phosphate decarboxylase